MKNLRKRTKRSIAMLLVTCMVLNIAGYIMPATTAHAATASSSTEGIEGFKELLSKLMKTGDDKTYNVSTYQMNFNQFVNAYFATAKKEAVAYYSYYNLLYSYTLDSNGYVATFKLRNIDSNFKTRYAQMQKEVDIALAGMDSNMTDLEKVVYIHDYLAYHAQYDKSTALPTASFEAYGVMVNKVGVCDSYSKAFMMFMGIFGISCNYVMSIPMNHSWVMVQVGTYYYHVDTTWDDPTRDTLGRVFHEFLLRTDDEFKSGLSRNHFGWTFFGTAKDTTYSNWEIHDVKTRIIYSNGDWYFVDSTNSIVKSDIMCTNKNTIIEGGATYGEAIYALEEYNGGWLYTQGNRLMYCDYDGSNNYEVFTLDPVMDGNEDTINYLHISDDDILTSTVYTFTDANDDDSYVKTTTYEYQLSYIQERIETSRTKPIQDTDNNNELPDENSETETPDTETPDTEIPDTEIPGSETFTKLEYIEIDSNNNSIDTNYLANSNTSISLDMAITSPNIYGNYINGYDNSSNRLTFRQESSKGLYVAYGWYNSLIYKPDTLEKFNISQLGALTYINDKLVRNATKQDYQMTNTLKIGTAKSRIYECKIWNGDQLVRDFVPILDEEGRAGLYDTVSNTYYYGNTDFSAGPTLESSADPTSPIETPSTPDTNSEYTVVSYIDVNSNDNRIDTGYLANSNTSISLDMAITSPNIYGNYISGFNNSSNRLLFRQEASNGLYVAYGWYNSFIYKPATLEKFNISQLGALTYINDKLVRTATVQNYQMTTSLKIGTAKSRIYGCKIWDGDQLIKEYIPVLDPEGVACLYDKVSDEFYYGTGSIGYEL